MVDLRAIGKIAKLAGAAVCAFGTVAGFASMAIGFTTQNNDMLQTGFKMFLPSVILLASGYIIKKDIIDTSLEISQLLKIRSAKKAKHNEWLANQRKPSVS